MRIAMLAAAVALFGTACYTESAPSRYYVASDRVHPEEFDAYTVSGDYVRVARDRATGDLIIVSPSELHSARGVGQQHRRERLSAGHHRRAARPPREHPRG